MREGPTERMDGASTENEVRIIYGSRHKQANKLTFHIQLYECGLAHAQGILGGAAVDAGRVSGHGTEIDLLVGTEDPIQALLPPKDGGGGITVRNAPQGCRVFLLLQVVQI